MKALANKLLTIETTIHAPVEKVWSLWTDPKHIINWSNASEEWHTTRAENDLREDGRFFSRMEAKDGSMGFDFTGVYHKVKQYTLIDYTIDDGREVRVSFVSKGKLTTVRETFEAEQENAIEMQRAGWQSILNSFKDYVENRAKGTGKAV
jgi:uncharacterized protein YndB with AHSA1/START domain